MEPKLNRLFILCALMFLTSASLTLQAQIYLNKPQPSGNPEQEGDPWTAICAGLEGFNQYFAEISWAGSPNAGNEFILELSDASGSFDAPVELARTDQTSSDKTLVLEFQIPTTTRGSGYKMRVRSTNPVNTSPVTDPYNMYYMDMTSHLVITEAGDGVPPGYICSEDPITLKVDGLSNPETYQYIWYRSGTVLGETGPQLTVNDTGMYWAAIDYGYCTGNANTDSNLVDVTIGGGTTGIGIAEPAQTSLCNAETVTLSIDMTDPSWSYQWFKDGQPILGAIATSYTVKAVNPGFEGEYQVQISGTGICKEKSPAVAITNSDNFTVALDQGTELVLLPGQSKTLSVSTTATSPAYQWYRNGSAVGNDSASFEATQTGTYSVAVTQGGGTCPGTVKNSAETTLAAPTGFEVTIAYAGTYTACENTTAGLEVTALNATLSGGGTLDVTDNLLPSFSFQWKKDGTNVTGATASTISLVSPDENGSYSVTGTLDAATVTSTALPIQLRSDQTVTISSTATLFCNTGTPIVLSTETDLSGTDFSWERDGATYNTTDTALQVTETGTYRLVLTGGGCPLTSNEIAINGLDESLISLDVDGDLVFPEGASRTVTASGGTAYQWFGPENNEVGTTATISISEPGTYTLIATVDACTVTKTLNASYLDTFNVPNVITPNGDGANDQWVLPNSYANKNDVRVIIYDDKGKEMVNQTSYKNNWPESATAFPQQNMVFYYIIKNPSKTLKQGTITVIR